MIREQAIKQLKIIKLLTEFNLHYKTDKDKKENT